MEDLQFSSIIIFERFFLVQFLKDIVVLILPLLSTLLNYLYYQPGWLVLN